MSPSCQSFLNRLEDFLEGRLTGAGRRALEAHLAECPRCRELRAAFDERAADVAVGPPTGFASAVLERTSGSPCEAAHGRLCDYVDRSLRELDNELVRMHLSGCEACDGLSRVVARLSLDLPMLAEIEPDDEFVHDILAQTVATAPRPASWTSRIVELCYGLMQRPRIAWEGACVGTFMMMLIFGFPTSPLAGIPLKALDIATVNPVAELKDPVARLETQVSTGARVAWHTTGAKLTGASRELATDAAARLERIKTDVGTLWERFASEQENDATTPTGTTTPRTEGD